MTSVTLLVYDLSNGLAKSLSTQLLGTRIDAIYHTSVAVFNREIFYGQGISSTLIKQTHYGTPIEEIKMGVTEIDYGTFKEFIREISSRFTAQNYHLLNFNCNTFTNEVCQFLLGKSIPSKIINLPNEFLSTPFGQMLQPMINQAFQQSSYESSDILDAPTAATLPIPPPADITPLFQHKSVIYLENDAEFDSLNASLAIFMFTSTTCAPCQQIKPMFIEYANQSPYPNPIFKPPHYPTAILIDTSKCPITARKFNISGVPTFVKIKNNSESARVVGADPTALLNLFQHTKHTPIPLELIPTCKFILNTQFNAPKNKEKLGQLGIKMPLDYANILETVDPLNWYPVFDYWRFELLSSDVSRPHLRKLVTKIHDLVHEHKSNLQPYVATVLCALRVFNNMFHIPNILLFPILRNGLMQLLPDLLDSILFAPLKNNILDILKNVGVWISKRQGLTRDSETNLYFVNEEDDLMLMAYASVCCEFINASENWDVMGYLAMVHFEKQERELIRTMLPEMDKKWSKYFIDN